MSFPFNFSIKAVSIVEELANQGDLSSIGGAFGYCVDQALAGRQELFLLPILLPMLFFGGMSSDEQAHKGIRESIQHGMNLFYPCFITKTQLGKRRWGIVGAGSGWKQGSVANLDENPVVDSVGKLRGEG